MRIILSDLFVIVVASIKICSSTTIVNYNEYCPEGYNRLAGKPICILVSKNPLPYDNECLKSGSTPILYYEDFIMGSYSLKPHKGFIQRANSQVIRNYLVAKKIKEVWLPIKKNGNNFLVWDLPGPMRQNGRVTGIDLASLPTEYSNGDCIVYDTNLENIRFEDCNRAYQLMCLIDTSEPYIVSSEMCDSKFIGRSSKFHESCFTITAALVGNTTNIDSNDTFVVVDQLIRQLNMQNEAILVYDPLSASPNSSAFKEGSIQIVDKHSKSKQVIHTQHVNTNSLSIDIEFNATSNQLTVIVTNYELLWNPENPEIPFWCYNEFDILADSEIKSHYRVIYSSKTSRWFGTNLLGNQRGIATIWCEGQMLKTFKQIKSNILMVERNLDAENFVFCAKLKWNCDAPCRIAAELKKIHFIPTKYPTFDFLEVHIKQILSLKQNRINVLLHFVVHFLDAEFSNKIDKLETVIAKSIKDAKITELRLSNVCESPNDFFPSAKLGEKVLANTLCYNSNGFLPAQDCIGNLIEGAHWKEVLDTTIFDGCTTAYKNTDSVKLFNVTKQLEDLKIHDQTAEKITELVVHAIVLMNTTLSKAENIKDTRLVSETIHNIAEIKQTNIFDVKVKESEGPGEIINPIIKMIDKILEFETKPLISDGNTMLDTIDQLTAQFANSSAFETKQVLDDEGVRIIRTNNLIIVFINPLIKNITGIELHRNKPEVEDFTDFKIITLHKNHRIEDANTERDTLEVMAHITSDAFDKIKITKDNVLVPPDRLIFKFYYKPSLFEEEINDSVHVTPDSKVIGITIPNFPMREYPKGVITMFKTITETTKDTETCGCSQNLVKSSSKKGWDTKLWNGTLETKNIVTCEVRRPGNIGFAKLVGVRIRDPEDTPMSQFVETVLNVTTFIGCTLSILGLILIFVTAIFNPAWQQNEATPLILNISTASLFLIVMYYVSEIFSKPQYIEYCPILGSLAQNLVKSSSKKGWDTKLWNGTLETKNIVTCEVRRPGNIGFAKLVGVRIRDPEDTPMSQFVETVLNVTTFIGCTLSILGLILIFVTAIFNPAWQQNEATPLILNISTASLFLIVMYYVSEIFSKPQYIEYCPILGSLAQYAVLVGFFVSVIVTNCQYHRYIVIFGNSVPKYLKLQIYLFGWLTPLLLVALCFVFASESYVKLDEDCQTEANGNITIVQTLTCFPTKITLYFGLHLPIIVIFCYNLSIYVWIIIRVRQEIPNLRKTPKKSTVYFQIRIFLSLFFIMSITWIFALLHHYTGFHIFALLFNVTGTMQGCILAIFCILVNQQTRTFWDRKLNKKQHYYCNET